MGTGNTILILLLGAFLPNTVEGTMVGKLASATEPAVALKVFFKKILLLFENSEFSMVKY
jgi:hypothetical protein